MTAAATERQPQPYATAAGPYFEAGWAPLPVRGKHPPPTGWTGHGAPMPSYADIYTWTETQPTFNVGLRLAGSILGIDVDAYGSKRGAATLTECENRWGPLPATWRSTSRDDGVSGIRFFTIPPGLAWPGELPGGGVELIHSGHRYAIVWPSLHPEGRVYRWLEPSGITSLHFPNPTDLPPLPPPWLLGLIRGQHTPQHSTPVEHQWLATLPQGTPCSQMATAAAGVAARLAQPQGRHEAALQGVLTIVRLAEQGHPGLDQALAEVERIFTAAVTNGDGARTPTEAQGEWERLTIGAAERVAGSPSPLRLPFDPCRPPLPGQPKGATPPNDRITNKTAPTAATPTPGTSTSGNPTPATDDVVATPATDIRPRRARWLWAGRLPLGALTLLAGPQGLGKSTLAYGLAAAVTKGELAGELAGQPRAVLITATEDAWPEIILPRLIAAEANLPLIYRLDAGPLDRKRDLLLPADIPGVQRLAESTGAALLLMDPLMSRLSGKLDSHKDAEVRQALEPLTRMLAATRLAGIGIAHLTKGSGTNVIDRIMGSVAFTAVARSVLAVVSDPEDEEGHRRLLGLVKSNFGRLDVPTLTFVVHSTAVDTDDGPTDVGYTVWGDTSESTVQEALEETADGTGISEAVREAADWLADWLEREGRGPSKTIKAEAHKIGISEAALKRARKRIRVQFKSHGFPRETWWYAQSAQPDDNTTVSPPVGSTRTDRVPDVEQPNQSAQPTFDGTEQ